MNRKGWLFLAVLFSLSFSFTFIFFVFFYPWEKDIEREKVRHIDAIRSQQGALEALANKMNTCADTSYFANYGRKSQKFYVYKLRNDTIDWCSSKRNNSDCLKEALELAATIGVDVWNNKRNSFYRFDFPAGTFWSASVYIPKQKSDTEQYVKEVEGMQKISSGLYLNLKRRDGTRIE